jgi:hypothetical protein
MKRADMAADLKKDPAAQVKLTVILEWCHHATEAVPDEGNILGLVGYHRIE